MTRKGRKNKRGEKGSLEVEEELSDAKLSNMAASEAGENKEMTKFVNGTYNPGQKYWDDLQNSSRTVPPPGLPHAMLIRCCVYLQAE